jgi:hypothetical protein
MATTATVDDLTVQLNTLKQQLNTMVEGLDEATHDPRLDDEDPIVLQLEIDRLQEDNYFLLNERDTDASYNRRLTGAAHFLNFTEDVVEDEVAFFFANVDRYEDSLVERACKRIVERRDFYQSLIDKYINTSY